jgi:hypothetical protein
LLDVLSRLGGGGGGGVLETLITRPCDTCLTEADDGDLEGGEDHNLGTPSNDERSNVTGVSGGKVDIGEDISDC